MASVKTQGTQLYFLDETVSPSVVVEIGCPTAYNPGGSASDQIETTCLGDTERTYVTGLLTPSQETFEIVFDPANTSHRRLETMLASGEQVTWYAGLSDGTNAPTISGGQLVAAASRTGFKFTASVQSLNYAIPINEVVRATVTLQRSGARTWTYAS